MSCLSSSVAFGLNCFCTVLWSFWSDKVGIALFVITVALGKDALFHGVLCVCMEENNTLSLRQKGQTDVSIAF
jgi:hypothetical protein